MNPSVDITLFDRQIRLLGIETQRKIGAVRIGVAGNFNHVMCEALKNFVLLGVRNYTLFGFENLYDSTLGYDTLLGMKGISPSVDFVLCDSLTGECDLTNIDYMLLFNAHILYDPPIPTFTITGQDAKVTIWCCCKPPNPLFENQYISATAAGLAGGMLCEEIVHHLSSSDTYSAKMIILDALEQIATCKKIVCNKDS